MCVCVPLFCVSVCVRVRVCVCVQLFDLWKEMIVGNVRMCVEAEGTQMNRRDSVDSDGFREIMRL